MAGTAILASWILILLVLRPGGRQLARVFQDTAAQMWGALLVGPFIFGLAYVFSYSGMAKRVSAGLGWRAVQASGLRRGVLQGSGLG